MKITVDNKMCEANGICVGMAPDVFDLDADDRLQIADLGIPETRRRELFEVVGSCPRGALAIDDV